VPDIGLRALLEHDQQPPRERAPRRLVDRLEPDRRVEGDAARHVDEGAIAPLGVVAGDQRGGAGRHDAPQVALDELGVLVCRLRERHHDRPF